MEERCNGDSICDAYDRVGNRIRKMNSKGATLYRYDEKNQLVRKKVIPVKKNLHRADKVV